MATQKIVVSLSVARVGHGGNTGKGQYFYSFEPDNILVADPDTVVAFELSDDTPDEIEIWKIVTSSPAQFRDVKFGKDHRSASLINANTVEQLISVSVLVTDKRADGRVLNCDPQMINVPR